MNRAQVRGTVRGFTGRLEEETGRLIGNREMQLRGIAKRLSGKEERNLGDAAETIKAVLRRH
ncbi:MAG TPA: hypothetical protein VMV33_11435 [Rhodocyclaceae bacterium]|nr:hypothetical protein [Rhodocyclaceae bacterium]